MLRVASAFTLALALAFAAASHADAQDREAARAQFQRGVDAFGRADYQAALDAFQEAYRLAPHPNVRVNIANCYENLGRPLEAMFHFEQFLAEATDAPRAQRREVEAAVRRVGQQVAQLELHVTPDGAIITIDGGEQRRAPVAKPVRVTAGSHTIEVRLDGYETARQTVTAAGGGTERIDIRLARPTVASAGGAGGATTTTETTTSASGGSGDTTTSASGGSESAATSGTDEGGTSSATTTSGGAIDDSPRDDGGGFRVTWPVWVAGGVTVAAAIVAGITGGLAIAANDDFEYNVSVTQMTGIRPEDIAQAQRDGAAAADRARTLALVTDVMIVTAVVGAGATVFLLLTTQDGGMLEGAAGGEGPTFALTPIAGPQVAGIAASGTF